MKKSSCPYFIKLLQKDTLRAQSVQENFDDDDEWSVILLRLSGIWSVILSQAFLMISSMFTGSQNYLEKEDLLVSQQLFCCLFFSCGERALVS